MVPLWSCFELPKIMFFISIAAINNVTSSKQDRQLPQAGSNTSYQPSFQANRERVPRVSQGSRKARNPQSKHNTMSRESVMAVLKDTPAVAAFDVHFKDSLPPIKRSEVHLHGAEGGRGRSRGAANGEEVDWQPTSHYDRYIIKLSILFSECLAHENYPKDTSRYYGLNPVLGSMTWGHWENWMKLMCNAFGEDCSFSMACDTMKASITGTENSHDLITCRDGPEMATFTQQA